MQLQRVFETSVFLARLSTRAITEAPSQNCDFLDGIKQDFIGKIHPSSNAITMATDRIDKRTVDDSNDCGAQSFFLSPRTSSAANLVQVAARRLTTTRGFS
ncbi:MAG: hypothetical protein ACKODU_11000 [Limnohabitans sp.]